MSELRSAVIENEITRDRSLSAAGRLEIERCCHTHRVGNSHAVFHDFFRPRNRELVHAVVVLACASNQVVELFRIETQIGVGI